MSFGKRGRATPPPPPGPPNGGGTSAPAAPDGEPGASPILWRQLRGIGIGVAIVLGLMLANNIGMRAMGRVLDAKWADGDGVHWTRIAPATTEPDGTVARRLRDMCLQVTPFPIRTKVTGEQLYEWELGITREKQLTTVAAFLACGAERMPERLCNSAERTRFAEQLKHYSKFYTIVASGKALTGLPPDPDVPMKQVVTRPAYEGEHERLGRSVRQLAERGYLSTSDFGFLGFGVPPELAPHLKVEAKERACQ